jgi:hypothetical protein
MKLICNIGGFVEVYDKLIVEPDMVKLYKDNIYDVIDIIYFDFNTLKVVEDSEAERLLKENREQLYYEDN